MKSSMTLHIKNATKIGFNKNIFTTCKKIWQIQKNMVN